MLTGRISSMQRHSAQAGQHCMGGARGASRARAPCGVPFMCVPAALAEFLPSTVSGLCFLLWLGIARHCALVACRCRWTRHVHAMYSCSCFGSGVSRPSPAWSPAQDPPQRLASASEQPCGECLHTQAGTRISPQRRSALPRSGMRKAAHPRAVPPPWRIFCCTTPEAARRLGGPVWDRPGTA